MYNDLLKEVKVFRDPIHTYITIEYQVIFDLLATFPFQRLRRISQLGGTSFVFSSAEHSRFTHSLGVYEITRRFINEVKDIKEELDEFEQITLLCAALLHDIGHGPFSHCFEHFFAFDHEKMSIDLILNKGEINQVLTKYHPDLPHFVALVIAKKHPKMILNQLLSSQLDADRVDYLLRDAYFCGTPYGYFDVDRLLRITRVKDHRVVFKSSGISAIENYMLGRYHMYGQVYYHPISLTFEVMIVKFLTRFKNLYEQNYQFQFDIDFFIPLFKNEITPNQFILLDDSSIYEAIKKSTLEEDDILKDLAHSILHRHLFDYQIVKSGEEVETIKSQMLEKNLDLQYYFYSTTLRRSIYKSYGLADIESIDILNKDGSIAELHQASHIVAALMSGSSQQDHHYIVFTRKEEIHEKTNL